MRLVFVHGINNENNTVESIESTWSDALTLTWSKMGLILKDNLVINTAFYGKLLADASNNLTPIAMGINSNDTSTLAIGLLQEYANVAGVTQAEINASAEKLGIPKHAVEQGVPHEGWVIAFADILEDILMDKGKSVAKLFLKQAVTYINDIALAKQIDQLVKAQIFDDKEDPALIVAHSLGTVVTYRLLANNKQAQRKIPLYLTLGSPLSVKMFKSILPAKGMMPTPPIARWVNGRHLNDFVTLGRPITEETIGYSGVEDITDIVNDVDDKHSVVKYLSSPKIAKVIYDSLIQTKRVI